MESETQKTSVIERRYHINFIALCALFFLLLIGSMLSGWHFVRSLPSVSAALPVSTVCDCDATLEAIATTSARITLGIVVLVFVWIGFVSIYSALAHYATTRFISRLLSGYTHSSIRLSRVARTMKLHYPVREVSLNDPYVCGTGILKKEMVISSTVLPLVNDDELSAILAHEQAHLDGNDPAKFLCASIISRLIGWIPSFRELKNQFISAAEIRADAHAIRATSKKSLAGALLALITFHPTSVPVPSFANTHTLYDRISILTDEAAYPHSRSFLLALYSICAILIAIFAGSEALARAHYSHAVTSIANCVKSEVNVMPQCARQSTLWCQTSPDGPQSRLEQSVCEVLFTPLTVEK